MSRFLLRHRQALISSASFLAQRKTLFHLLRPYEWWLKRSDPDPDLARFSYHATIGFLRQAYSRKKPVFWASLFFPAEFIQAAGGIPFYPEIAAGLTAALGFSLPPLERAEKAWFSADLCSYHRLSVGMSLLRLFPRPDFLVATSHICSGTVGFFEALARIWQVSPALIDVPLQDETDSVDYLTSQLTNLQADIIRQTGMPFRHEKAWDFSNQARALCQEIQTTRFSHETTVHPPGKVLDYLPYYYQFMGTQTATTFFQKFLTSLRSDLLPSRKLHRLYWLHLKPFFSNPLAHMLTDYDLGIAGEEFTRITWPVLDKTHPMESLARKILAARVLTVPGLRIEQILRDLAACQAQGVIQYNHWGCRQSQGMNHLLRQALRREGYPLLFLDGDHLDPRHHSEAQLRTRLEAFAEMVGS